MEISKEEKKAIEEVKNIIEEVTENTKQEIPTYIFDRDIKCLPTVLNLIEKQDKMIDYMAEDFTKQLWSFGVVPTRRLKDGTEVIIDKEELIKIYKSKVEE